MYYIEKEGAYNHGVFWIGEDLYEGVTELLNLTYKDKDDYHHWCIKEYEVGNQCTTILDLSKYIKEDKHHPRAVLTTANGSANVFLGGQLFKDYLNANYTLTKEEGTTC